MQGKVRESKQHFLIDSPFGGPRRLREGGPSPRPYHPKRSAHLFLPFLIPTHKLRFCLQFQGHPTPPKATHGPWLRVMLQASTVGYGSQPRAPCKLKPRVNTLCYPRLLDPRSRSFHLFVYSDIISPPSCSVPFLPPPLAPTHTHNKIPLCLRLCFNALDSGWRNKVQMHSAPTTIRFQDFSAALSSGRLGN